MRSWNNVILDFIEDDKTYSFAVEQHDRVITVVLWKDKSMVAIQGDAATFLVANAE